MLAAETTQAQQSLAITATVTTWGLKTEIVRYWDWFDTIWFYTVNGDLKSDLRPSFNIHAIPHNNNSKKKTQENAYYTNLQTASQFIVLRRSLSGLVFVMYVLSLSLSLSSLHWTRQSKLCSQITCHKLSMKAQHTQFSHTRCIWKQNSVACCPRPNGDDPVAFIHPYFDQAPVTTLLNVANQRTIYTSFDEMV